MEDVQKFTGIVDELRNMKSNNLTSRLDELQNEMQEIAKKIEITDNFIHNLERNERETGVDERELSNIPNLDSLSGWNYKTKRMSKRQ